MPNLEHSWVNMPLLDTKFLNRRRRLAQKTFFMNMNIFINIRDFIQALSLYAAR